MLHDADDAEVTKIYHFIDKKSKTLLGGYDTTKQSFRGDPKEIILKSMKTLLAKKEERAFQKLNGKKFSKSFISKREAFTRADNAPFYKFINSYGMTPKDLLKKLV